MIRVIQVIPAVGHESSGPSYSVPMLCHGLTINNVDATLHFLGACPVWLRNASFGVATYLCLDNFRFGWSSAMLKGLCEACKTADIIHDNSLWMMPNVYPAWAVKGTKCKLVVAPRGTLASWSLKKGWLKKKIFGWLLQNRVLRRADMFHATSEKEYEEIRAAGYKQPVAIVPIGMEIPKFESLRVSRFESFEGQRLHRVVFFGRLHKVKAVDRLVQAWGLLNQSNNPNIRTIEQWELVIAGPDNGIRGELEQYIADHKIPRVRFVGEINGPAKYEFLSAADLYVLPSHTENFGVTVAEALACGTPVIVSKGTPWQGVEGEKEVVVESGSCRGEVVVESGSGTVEEREGRGARSTVEFEIVRGEEAPFCKTAEALAWARLHGLIGRMGENETGGKGVVTISAESIRETLNPRQREKSVSQSVHFAALMKLRELIRASRILEVHPDWLKDSSGKRSPAVGVNHDIAICVAYAAFGIGDVVYRVRLTLKRYRQTKSSKVYAYRVNEIEVVPGTLGGKIALTTNPTGTTSICGTILLNGALDVNGVPLLAGDEGESEVVVGSGSGTMKRSASNTQTLKHSNNSSRCGWWVSNDPETLAKTLHEAMALSDDERRRMGEAGRDWIRRDFSWEGVGAKMKAAYEWLLDPQNVSRPDFIKY